jgi:hypothetical protein
MDNYFQSEAFMAGPETNGTLEETTKMGLRDCFQCTALTALGGWLVVCNVVFPLLAAGMYGSFIDYALICGLAAIFVAAGCAMILLPALLILPMRSMLLRWPVATANGAFAGSVLFSAYYLLGDRSPSVDSLAFCFRVGAAGGAVTGLLAGLLVGHAVRRLRGRTGAPGSTNDL